MGSLNSDCVYLPIKCHVEVSAPTAARKQPARKGRALGIAVSRSRSTDAVFLVVGEELPTSVSLASAQLNTAARSMCFSLASIISIHAKAELLSKGGLTIELRDGALTLSVFVRNAQPEDLATFARALVEGVRRSKASSSLDGTTGLALLQDHFPEQCKRALKDKQRGGGGDDFSPQPQKGHVRLMMVVEAVGSSPAEAGRRAAQALSNEFGLKQSAGLRNAPAGGFSAAFSHLNNGKKALELRVLPATHHKLKMPLWIDAEIDTEHFPAPISEREGCINAGGAVATSKTSAVESVLARAVTPPAGEVRYSAHSLPHRSVLERLPGSISCHLRSGISRQGTKDELFATRFELRNANEPPSAAPLGRCDLTFYETASQIAGPVAVSLRMNKDACKAWAAQGKDRQMSALGTILVERVEIFCQRLLAPATGNIRASRAVLVAGWLPEVTVAPFVRRDFLFHDQDPEKSLGSKFLKDTAPVRPENPKKRKAHEQSKDAKDGSTEVGALSKPSSEELEAPSTLLSPTHIGDVESTDRSFPKGDTRRAVDTPYCRRANEAKGPKGSPLTKVRKSGKPKLFDEKSTDCRAAEGEKASELEADAWADAEELGSLGKTQSTGSVDAPNDDEADALLAETLGEIGAEMDGEAQAPDTRVALNDAGENKRKDESVSANEDEDIDATIEALMRG